MTVKGSRVAERDRRSHSELPPLRLLPAVVDVPCFEWVAAGRHSTTAGTAYI